MSAQESCLQSLILVSKLQRKISIHNKFEIQPFSYGTSKYNRRDKVREKRCIRQNTFLAVYFGDSWLNWIISSPRSWSQDFRPKTDIFVLSLGCRMLNLCDSHKVCAMEEKKLPSSHGKHFCCMMDSCLMELPELSKLRNSHLVDHPWITLESWQLILSFSLFIDYSVSIYWTPTVC